MLFQRLKELGTHESQTTHAQNVLVGQRNIFLTIWQQLERTTVNMYVIKNILALNQAYYNLLL